MKTLKILNIIAFLLIFTPFFQMCSGNEPFLGNMKMEEATEETTIEDTTLGEDSLSEGEMPAVKDYLVEKDTLSNKSDSLANADAEASANILQPKDDSWGSRFWELITIPGDNVTITGFGLLVCLISEIIDLSFKEIELISVLVAISIVLTITSLIKIFRNRTKALNKFFTIQVLLLGATLITAAIRLEKISQIKWGFYIYFLFIVAMLIKNRQVVKEIKQADD